VEQAATDTAAIAAMPPRASREVMTFMTVTLDGNDFQYQGTIAQI
jgi:hypothetical protein